MIVNQINEIMDNTIIYLLGIKTIKNNEELESVQSGIETQVDKAYVLLEKNTNSERPRQELNRGIEAYNRNMNWLRRHTEPLNIVINEKHYDVQISDF